MDGLDALAARIGTLLADRHLTVSVAESCTGGLVADAITNVSGSSDYFVGGIVCYANRAKRDLVGVPEELMVIHGAVSPEVALALVRGVRRALCTDVGLATTGIAGPTGGTPVKPVGTVYLAVSSSLGEQVEHHVWDSDRVGNKRLSAHRVLTMLEQHLVGGQTRAICSETLESAHP